MQNIKGAIVFGHPRSGTTLLRRLLSAHRDISAPPETYVFDAAARFLHADVSAEGTDVGVLAGLNYLGFNDNDTLSRLKQLCFGFLEEYAEQEGKSLWLEKTAFQAFRMREIVRLCGDDIRYIGIVRHPFDVAASTIEFCQRMGAYPDVLHKYVQRHKQPLEAFLTSWRDVAQGLVDLGTTRPQQCMLIRYEDLIEAPEATVEAILEFLGVDTATDFLTSALERQGTPGFSDHKAYRSTRISEGSAGRWIALPKAQVSALAHVVADEMELFGYDPISCEDEADIRLARRAYIHGLGFGSESE